MAVFKRVRYQDLDSRQQESYNFQKVSAVLADYGIVTIRLSSDWQGADFIAQESDGVNFLAVQLKGRLTFDKKYERKGLYVCFRSEGEWFLYPHDVVLAEIQNQKIVDIRGSGSWKGPGTYHFPRLSRAIRRVLTPYRLAE